MGEVAGDSAAAGAVVASGAAVAAGLSAGAAVSVFCSHAASKAALARMQMYFFIISVVEKPIYAVNPDSRQAAFSVLLARSEWRFVFDSMRLGDRLAGEPAVACIDAAGERRIFLAGFFQAAIGQ